MKINILGIGDGRGGGNNFLRALKKEFVKRGVYSEDPLLADVVLFNSFPFRHESLFLKAYSLKKRGKKLVHRLDGPISMVRGRDYFVDKLIFWFNDYVADATIFQSRWSKKQNRRLGLKRKRMETVIINAPDSSIFSPKKPVFSGKKLRLISVSWSSNWNKGFSTLKWLDENLDFKKYDFVFVGNSPVAFDNVVHKPPLSHKELIKEFRRSQIFIFPSKKEPCSNALLEALHSGLPAIVFDGGGNTELVSRDKPLGLLYSKDEEIPSLIEKVAKNPYKYYHPDLLPDISKVADDYLNFFKQVREEPPRSLFFFFIVLFFWKVISFIRFKLRKI